MAEAAFSLGAYYRLFKKPPSYVPYLVRRRVYQRLVAFTLLLEQQHVAGDRFCVANRGGGVPHLPEQMRSAQGDGEDRLKFLSGEAWKGTSSTAEQMRVVVRSSRNV